jgi:hypothetical protein
MTQKTRPSIYDWPAMANDLKNTANKSPHYPGSKHPPAMGSFARDGFPLIVVFCTLDSYTEGFKILHISFSVMDGSNNNIMNILEEIDEIAFLFDKNQPYFYKGRDGHINFCWPRPWENKAAHEYLDNKQKKFLKLL